MRKSKAVIITTTLAALALGGSVTVFAATSSGSNSATTNTATSRPPAGQQQGRHGMGAFHGERHHGIMRPTDVAKILGVDVATFKSDLKAGQSIADIAQSKGIQESALITSLESKQKANLDAAVQSGKLTATKETTLITGFANHVKQMVEHKGMPTNRGGRGGRGMMMHQQGARNQLITESASILNISQATLVSDLRSGKSLAQIAGNSTATLIQRLVASEQSRLQQAVTSGKLTQTKATQMTTNLTARITKFVNATPAKHHAHP